MLIKIIFGLLSIASLYITMKISYLLLRDYRISKAFGTLANFKRTIEAPLFMLIISTTIAIASLIVVLFI